MKRSTTKAVRDRLMISTALIALAALAPVSIAFAESGGDGGLRSSTTFPGGEGGESQTTGQGEDGGTGSVFTTGGGGGGAGTMTVACCLGSWVWAAAAPPRGQPKGFRLAGKPKKVIFE